MRDTAHANLDASLLSFCYVLGGTLMACKYVLRVHQIQYPYSRMSSMTVLSGWLLLRVINGPCFRRASLEVEVGTLFCRDWGSLGHSVVWDMQKMGKWN